MSPIPSSSLPGLSTLHKRVTSALEYRSETEWIEFKCAADWDGLKHKIVRTCLAMSNQRDGGIIIVGVGESGNEWELTGIDGEQRDTYDADDCIDFINRYSSPAIHPVLATVEYDGKAFLAIDVAEFDSMPIVCRRNGPEGTGLEAGRVYVRDVGKARTTRVMTAEQMRNLLELAAEKRARELIGSAKRIGMEAPDISGARYEEEREGL